MRNITISSSTDSVVLATDMVYEIEYEEVSVQKVMASGKIVKDILGHRPILEIPVGLLKLEDVRKLKKIINSGEFLTINYPGIDGDQTGVFSVSQPTYKGVVYGENGVDYWIGMELKCKAQEVEQ